MDAKIIDNFAKQRYLPRGLLLQWHVTERCNLHCAHCYQESSACRELGFQDLLQVVDQFKELLDSWRKEAAPQLICGHITVTGGEPFVRRDFLDLLDAFAANKKHFRFAILTNGYFIDAPMARRLRQLGPSFVQVSIEGSQATHDHIRGPGNYERTVAAIKHLVRQRLATLISFTAHKGNFREFAEVARLGRRLGVARVWADRLIPLGSALNLTEQMLSLQETREFFQIMHQARTEAERSWFNRTEIAMHRALQFLVAGGRPYRCTAATSLLALMPNGDVYPCRRMPIRVGNLMETDLATLYYQSDLLCALRDRTAISHGCEDCRYAHTCAGGLRCLAYAVSCSPFRADPGCWLANLCRARAAQKHQKGDESCARIRPLSCREPIDMDRSNNSATQGLTTFS